VYALIEPGRTVDVLSDLARLGEFDGSKALYNLVNLGLVKALPAPRRSKAAEVGAYARGWRGRVTAGVAGVAATVAMAAALAGLAYVGVDRSARASGGAVRDTTSERFLGRHQLARLHEALEIYRLERGEYPDALAALVETGLATRTDLRWPWRQDYHYRRKAEGGFVLLPPFE
jgi:hypothetical protein